MEKRKWEKRRKEQSLMNMHVTRWIEYYIIRGEVTESWTNFGGFKSTSTVGWFKKLALEREGGNLNLIADFSSDNPLTLFWAFLA